MNVLDYGMHQMFSLQFANALFRQSGRSAFTIKFLVKVCVLMMPSSTFLAFAFTLGSGTLV